MRITVLVDNPKSWYCPYAVQLVDALRRDHDVTYVQESKDIPQGDCAFLLSCSRLIRSEVLKRNGHNIVVHSSPLPEGRGFAPLTWQILEGRSVIVNTMFEAAESVDSGPIYATNEMHFLGHELIDELREMQAEKIAELVMAFVAAYPDVWGRPQVGTPTSYVRRRAVDSQLDVDKSIAEQFNLLRVVDNDSYPAYFHYRGFKYVLRICKDGPVTDGLMNLHEAVGGKSKAPAAVPVEATPLEVSRA